MELKNYQLQTLKQTKKYLELLSIWRGKNQKAIKVGVGEINWPKKAWEEFFKGRINKIYHSKQNGLNQQLPNFCLKIPTGGGKTLLAVKTIDLINQSYLNQRQGLVLWIVPTNQIYKQTLKNLKDKSHPYRQMLDNTSSNKTMILERWDKFTPSDIQENLIIMMLMLPAASRQNKETLRMFRDSGGYTEFFPSEEKIEDHQKILAEIPNLDHFGNDDDFWGKQIKTSLGNTLRLLRPIIILDEGHKAYSEIAQSTLRGFNPSILLELSATPPENSNKLVNVSGTELNQEEMIKLDLHIVNKASTDWTDTMRASIQQRDLLEKTANDHRSNTNKYIRPICLIQVENTGPDQRDGKSIHAEDVKEWLIKIAGIKAEEIAIKSSSKDDIEGIDLLSDDCSIRYIITKYALQEGWDCPFAYVLTILTNTRAPTSLTQLIGRILRQPYARKTNVRLLDESYVFCFKQDTHDLLEKIKKGFEKEGLGDLASRISEGESLEDIETQSRTIYPREEFKQQVDQILLPFFASKQSGQWSLVNYEMDIAQFTDWSKVDLSKIKSLSLARKKSQDFASRIGIHKDPDILIKTESEEIQQQFDSGIDTTYITRNILDIVTNPWTAHLITQHILEKLSKKHKPEQISANLPFIIEELRKILVTEKDKLSKQVFDKAINKGDIKFMLIKSRPGLPKKQVIKSNWKKFNKQSGEQLQKSLFDYVAEEGLNETEKAVAWYLDDQKRLLFWYRNISKHDYYVQGWHKQKIYPDFLFSTQDNGGGLDKVHVIETKGLHLKDSDDTNYKRRVFDLCNDLGTEKAWADLGLQKDLKINYQVLAEDEWQNKLNKVFN
ncbi:DEAD/DEAH box helicase family protein [Patescibacteria group bacterium]|nr:DEAD/DEAH box helicase family protein [Patescibacteria group bacterium]